jgi:hypothetical protein
VAAGGEGLFSFNDIDAAAARRVAERFFDSKRVLGRVLGELLKRIL